MRSIKRRFDIEVRRHPESSSYICFTRAINGQRFTKDTTVRWFNKLVENDDYDRADKKKLIGQLERLLN